MKYVIPAILVLLLVCGCKKKEEESVVAEEGTSSAIRLYDLLEQPGTKVDSDLTVDASSFGEYQGEGWSLAGNLISADKKRCTIIFPNTEPKPPEWILRFRVRSGSAARFRASINGKEWTTFVLTRNWQNLEYKISESSFRNPNEKKVILQFSGKLEKGKPFAEFQNLSFPVYSWDRLRIGKEFRSALSMLGKASVSFSIRVPRGRPRLFFGIGLPENPSSEVAFQIAVRENETKTLFHQELKTAGWASERVDLSPFAGKEVTLQLTGTPKRSEARQLLAWSAPEIHDVSFVPSKPNIILFSVDTLRADRLSAYGNDAPITPHMDSLASRSTVFQNAFCTAPSTLPSHASLMTGQYVARHQVSRPNEVLPRSLRIPPDMTTLAETAYAQNYYTAAFTDAGFVSVFYGFYQGFLEYIGAGSSNGNPLSVNSIEDAVGWLKRNSDRPFFLFLHTYSVHEPFNPPPEIYQELFPDEMPDDGKTSVSMQWLLDVVAGKIVPTEKEKKFVRNCYDAGVHLFDRNFGRLLNTLADLKLQDNTVIILFSDHGELLFDHGSGFGHGKTLTYEEVRVPLVLYIPGQPANVRKEITSIVDIYPTVAELLGTSGPEQLDGISLLLPPGSPEWKNRAVYYEVAYGNQAQWGVRTHEFKLVLDHQKKREFFYDFRKSPVQIVDTNTSPPRAFGYMRDMLSDYIQNSMTAAAGRRFDHEEEVTGELREQLKALGYLN